MRSGKRLALALLVGTLAAGIVSPATTMAAAPGGIPVLAHYYIWFQPSSWNRAKTDLPALGPYSSDDTTVLRQHVRWAKDAGIDGFLVSWKSTPVLNSRIEKLIQIAGEEKFKLGIVYQGLDFERRPLPIDQVRRDLEFFADTYAANNRETFGIFEKPLVAWSGTWEYADDEIRLVTSAVRDRLFVLAMEKQTPDYEEIASLVDGNAYYWSSVNPETNTGYEAKLQEMSAAVHANGGLWIAPAAPGFDAREVGGTTEIARRDGQTLRDEMSVAMKTSPDAIAVISWNEFSENTHIEPSQDHGSRDLAVLADVLGAKAPDVQSFESDGPPSPTGFSYGIPLIAGFVAFVVAVGIIGRRRRTAQHPEGTP